MGLKFILPGYENIELLHNGANKNVNIENLREYVDLIIENYLIKTT